MDNRFFNDYKTAQQQCRRSREYVEIRGVDLEDAYAHGDGPTNDHNRTIYGCWLWPAQSLDQGPVVLTKKAQKALRSFRRYLEQLE